MNKPKDRVKIKLQKTISNLISNVISSLCQQVVQYETSIGIFGLLSINIDGDVDISVKLNETFVKKESNLNINYSKLIETIQKPDGNKSFDNIVNSNNNNDNNDIELEQMEMEIEPKESDCPLLIDESEKSSLSFGNNNNKRRPRKPQHTFRHIAEEESNNNNNNNSKESEKAKDNSPETDIELKIDTQFEYQTGNKSTQFEPINRSIETDESDDKIRDKSIDKISHSSSIINIDNKLIDNDNSFSHLSTNKPTQTYKCSICDRQFKRKFCLTRHKRVHQNYKTYLCNVCGLGFDLINQLKRHLRNTHACSRENLRRSCRNNNNNNSGNNKSSEELIKSSPDRFCPTIECSWQLTKPPNQLPLLPTTKQSDNCLTTKSLCFNQFSFPPNLIIANSSKKPSPSAFSQTFSTTPTSASTQYQVRQMFNSIMSATEASLPYNNAAMYYMQNYTNILPTTSNALYHHPVTNGSGQKSMPILSSAPTPTTTNTMTLTNSFAQRLPIYRFPAGLFTSPSLKSIPLPLNSSWTGITRANDSNQSDNNNVNSNSKIKQSASPTISAAVNQITKVTSD